MSNENKPKVYVNGISAKARQTDYGEFINLGVNVDKVIAFLTEHRNEAGFVNLTVAKRREVGQFGDTHTVMLDTWKPKEQAAGGATAPAAKPAGKKTAAKAPVAPPDPEVTGVDDIPF